MLFGPTADAVTEPTISGTGVPLNKDPKYLKYFKMKKMGLPNEVVKHAMEKDGMDPSILDLDPNLPLIPLKDDPKYSKYFKVSGP